MALVKFTNGQRNSLRSPYTDVFGSFFNPDPFFAGGYSKVPAVNIAESENEFQIELAAPGLRKDLFKINVEDDQLIVSSEQKTGSVDGGEDKKYTRKEYSYASFRRTFNLPETADQSKIEAQYTDGVLLITVGKKEEAKAQSREIAVK